MMDGLVQDVRLACRRLSRAPAFSATAVLICAIGMAAATSMFALIEGIVLRPLGFPADQQLVVGWRRIPESDRRWPFQDADIALMRTNSRGLAGVAGFGYNDPSTVALVERDATTFIRAVRVTGGFFEVLGTAPALGRTLTMADDARGAERALVISHALWQRRYGGSRDVVGRPVTVAGQPFVIVGVMPPDVEHPRGVEAWAAVAAMQTTTTNPVFRQAMRDELLLVARMRPATTIAAASAELQSMAPALAARRPGGDPRTLLPVLQPLKESIVGDVRPALLLLFGAVMLVLVVAGANAASLLLARGEARRAEFGVRLAVGASRGRLVRQLLVESAVLAALAALIGLLGSRLALDLLLPLVPTGLPRTEGIAIGREALGFALALAAVVTVATAVAPALWAARPDLSKALREGRVAGPGGRRGMRLIVTVQVGLAVVVVAAAMLLGRSLFALRAAGSDVGANRLTLVSLALPQSTDEDRGRQARFMNALVDRLGSASGIVAATPVNATPFSGIGWNAPTYTPEDQPAERARLNPSLDLEEVYPNYFRTLGVPILRGRAFTPADREGAPLVAIIGEDVAARTWPGQDPIGKRLKLGDAASIDPWRTVVGVAARTRYRELRAQRPSIYVPAAQFLGTARDLVVNSTAPPAVVASVVREQLDALDASARVEQMRPFAELLEVPLARPRFDAVLIAVFAAATLALVAVGLYAVVAAFVEQRRAEIGVRMALGATAGNIRRLVLGEALKLTGAGAVLGFATAAALGRALPVMLFDVGPLDPVALGGAALLIAATAVAGLFPPVRAAGRVEPAVTLRG